MSESSSSDALPSIQTEADGDNPDVALAEPRGGQWPGRAEHRGPLILGLGATSIVCTLLGCALCLALAFVGLGTGIPAIIMARKDMPAMREGRMDPAGYEHTRWGLIMGICGTTLSGLFTIALVLMLIGYSALITWAALQQT